MRQARIEVHDTVRLVDSRYGVADEADDAAHSLDALADGDAVTVATLVDLVSLTSARALAERGDSPDFPRNVLAAGVPLAHVINAAFTYPSGTGTGGGRFNDEQVGAWYAGHDVATARTEVEHHRRRFLDEAGIVTADLSFTPYLSDINARGVRLSMRPDRALLDPVSYARSQEFGRQCRASGTGVIDYPSVRRASGRCVAVLVPHLVQNVRRVAPSQVRWESGRFTWA